MPPRDAMAEHKDHQEEDQIDIGVSAQDEEIHCLGKEQRLTHKDMRVLLETIREIAVAMAWMQKRLEETPPAIFEQERLQTLPPPQLEMLPAG